MLIFPFSISYASSVGAKHYYTSAKQSKGIQELFLVFFHGLLDVHVYTYTCTCMYTYTCTCMYTVEPL